MIRVITAVGSRQTPENILAEMKKIGHWCSQYGVTIRSGHAEGADWAFEYGAQYSCQVYLPWKNFNSHLKSSAQVYIYDNVRASKIAKKYHPAYDKLSDGAKKLIDRDSVNYDTRDQQVITATNKYIKDVVERYMPYGFYYVIVDENFNPIEALRSK